MKKIQVLKPYYRIDECLAEIKECLEIGWTGMGYKTEVFEKQWCDYTKLNNAHFLNSATAGLHLAVKVLKDYYRWPSESEVITTGFTFISTNHAIKYEGLQPVFCDIDHSLNLDPEQIRKKITPRTKAIIFVGLGGNAENYEKVREIAKEHDIKFILDAAHMAGSRLDGAHVGNDCDVSIFSFQAVKNLPTADSGMICFAEKHLDSIARKLSWLGIDKDTFNRSTSGTYKWDYGVDEVGYKYHGNSIMAALGIVGLKYLDKDNEYRRSIAREYINNLGESVEYIHHHAESSQHIFQIVVENREEVINHLSENSVYPGVHYRQNTEYSAYKVDYPLPVSDYYSKRILTLPIHMEITSDDVERISKLVKQAIN